MTQPLALQSCFVAGTDTGVGKTHISAALLHWCALQGWASAGLKPLAAGTTLVDGHAVNDDVQALKAASAVNLSDAEVGPFQFAAACAPHIAAQLEGKHIKRGPVLAAAHALMARAEVTVVEGVGGFCVPLNDSWDTADLAHDLGLPVVLVVGMRLGCLSHALLTAEAIRARGLSLAGWVSNVIDPDMAHLSANLDTLRYEMKRRHQAPCLGSVPWMSQPTPARIAPHFDAAALQALFAPGHPLKPAES
jgi:dethiobiotin synthetase